MDLSLDDPVIREEEFYMRARIQPLF